MSTDFELIEKELISNLSFPAQEVLEDKEAIIQRKKDLDRALTLGNLEHFKIKIFFEDESSKKSVETTIWGVTDNRVILKKGVVIPVYRIYKVV